MHKVKSNQNSECMRYVRAGVSRLGKSVSVFSFVISKHMHPKSEGAIPFLVRAHVHGESAVPVITVHTGENMSCSDPRSLSILQKLNIGVTNFQAPGGKRKPGFPCSKKASFSFFVCFSQHMQANAKSCIPFLVRARVHGESAVPVITVHPGSSMSCSEHRR